MNFKNIILISIDALRYDCLNYQTTPTLYQLKKNSIYFPNAFSTSVFTSPAHTSLFTGLYPLDHKIREFFFQGEYLKKEIHTLGEFFQQRGFNTFFHSDFIDLFASLGLTRGFRHCSDKDSDFFNLIQKNNGRGKNLIFLHFFDVHSPYLFCHSDILNDNADYFAELEKIAKDLKISFDNPFWNRMTYDSWNRIFNPLQKNNKRNILLPLYRKGVSKFDKGRFKFFLDFFEKNFYPQQTVFFIFSDHGEGQSMYHQPEIFGHGPHLSTEVLRVPFLVYSQRFNKKIINKNILSLKNLHFLIRKFADKIDLNTAASFASEEDFIYAESYSFKKFASFSELKSTQESKSDLIKRRQNDYFLFERAIITKKEKLLLFFSPEKLIRKINRLFLLHLLPSLVRKAILRRIFFKKNYPLFLYTKIDDQLYHEGKTDNIINLINKIFLINHIRVKKERVVKFLQITGELT